jgi:hypothetical protein
LNDYRTRVLLLAKTAISAQTKAVDAASLNVYAPMAFSQPAQQGIINRRTEVKTG